MVIQSLTNNYTKIPDEEDVTPIDNLNKNLKKKFQYVLIAVMTAAILIVGLVVWVSFSLWHPSVQIFLTSFDQRNLHQISLADVQESLPQLSSLTFGNVVCITERLSGSSSLRCDGIEESVGQVIVNTTLTFQTVLGFGGAFTEAAAHNFYRLPKAVQEKVLQYYFGEEGLGLALGRLHINSCDFSLESYSFDDVKDDFNLNFFDDEVTHDMVEIIPFIQSAMEISSNPIRLIASPWSPPAWMKVPQEGNQSMTGSAVPNGLKQDSRIQLAWARYISRFITAYKRKNIPIWAVTPQNEPEFPAPWEACSFNSSAELAFISNFLGPVLRSDHPGLKILAFDHNKDHLRAWAEELYHGDSNNFIDGMAFHCKLWLDCFPLSLFHQHVCFPTGYGGEDRWTDGTYGYNNVNATYHLAPDKILLATEACSCPGVARETHGGLALAWLRAERLAHDILFDLLNHAQGWIHWNLLVDSKGGPNHKRNFCDATIIANEDFEDVTLQPQFHYFAHFSKFVRPGAIRVASEAIGEFHFSPMEANIQANVELGMFPCEHSARQIWQQDPLERIISLTNPAYEGGGNLCIAHGDENRNYFRVAACDDESRRLLKLHWQADSLQAIDLDSGLCLSLAADIYDAGALLELTPCIHNEEDPRSRSQRFILREATGEIMATANGLCLTAGWPFLNSVAFITPDKKYTVAIVMNEAPVSTSIAVHDARRGASLAVPVPRRSILTFRY